MCTSTKLNLKSSAFVFFSPALWNSIEKKHYNATLVYRYYWFRSNCDESLFYSVLSLESPLIRAAAAMVSRAVHFDNKWNKLSFPCFDWNSLYNHLERKLKMVKLFETDNERMMETSVICNMLRLKTKLMIKLLSKKKIETIV